MTSKCRICDNEVSIDWFGREKKYCSSRCYTKDNAGILAILAIVIPITFISIGVWLITKFGYPLSSVIALLFILGATAVFTFGIQSIFGFRFRKEDKKREKARIKNCFYCSMEMEVRSEEKAVCMSCGNQLPFCDLCHKYIEFKEEISQLEPCGHIFHKTELLDWTKENKTCPKCNAEIDFVDLKS